MPEIARDSIIGLCLHCRYATIVRSAHNAAYYLCERSKTDPDFAKYPRLPVLSCSGFEPRDRKNLDEESHP